MAGLDIAGIAAALAARLKATTPPAGYDAIRSATAELPGQMVPLPALLVFVDAGTFPVTGNGTRLGTHDWIARLYLGQSGDLIRDMRALMAWLGPLCDQLRGAVTLSGTVTVATVERYRLGTLSYAGNTYSGLELGIRLVTTEPWAATA